MCCHWQYQKALGASVPVVLAEGMSWAAVVMSEVETPMDSVDKDKDSVATALVSVVVEYVVAIEAGNSPVTVIELLASVDASVVGAAVVSGSMVAVDSSMLVIVEES